LFDEVHDLRPSLSAGEVSWQFEEQGWELLFLGRASTGPAATEPARPSGVPRRLRIGWAEQRHTADVVEAVAGSAGVADGLLVSELGLAALVRTADCLPIALLAEHRAAMIHAGWRGIAAGLPTLAAGHLGVRPGEIWTAWIGPSIGACCYEVGSEVVAAVEAASGGRCRIGDDARRPHLDLRRAAALQLRAAGASRISLLDHCTKCSTEWLWSYRRDGERAGRNLSLLWRGADPGVRTR